MLTSQRLQLELSEKRKAINEMTAQEEYEIDRLDALNKEYLNTETRYQAAIISEAADAEKTATEDLDSEGKEIRRLEAGVQTHKYFEAALNDNPLTGREAELESALGIQGIGVQLPWLALLSPKDRELSYAATEAPDGVDVNANTILSRIFANGAGAHMGVRYPAVPVGASNYPVLSNGVAPTTVAPDGDADQTAATLTGNNLDPLRLTAEYLIRHEDLAKYRFMEEALRADLQGALTEAADKQIVVGNASSGDAQYIAGLQDALTAPGDPTNVATFADYASARAQQVDGRYARGQEDVRVLCGPATYQHAAGIYQSGSGVSALAGFAPMVSPHIPAAASDIQLAFVAKADGRAVAPMWPSIALIRDSVGGSAKGQVRITAIALWNFKVLDKDAYNVLKFKLA